MQPSARGIVVSFGLVRCGLGVAYLLAPEKLGRTDAVLMTRSFAVRELVLGIGGLQSPVSQARTWARLGALVDLGDALAATIAVRRRLPLAKVALVTAAGGLALEGWAARQDDADTDR